MKNIIKKTLFVLLIFLLIFMSLKTTVSYAKTESEELKELLDEYEEDLGDLDQFKKVVDEIYNDLNTATKVDKTLKDKLNASIDKIGNVDGISPLLKSILDIELKSQVSNLTDENIGEMREEISVIKEWVDSKVGNNENNGANTGNGGNNGSNNVNNNDEKISTTPAAEDKSVSSQILPKAGIKETIIMILVLLSICTVVWIIRYIQLKEIK